MDARKVLTGVAIVVWSGVALKAAAPHAVSLGHALERSGHEDGPVATLRGPAYAVRRASNGFPVGATNHQQSGSRHTSD